jgi:hypothetical protein
MADAPTLRWRLLAGPKRGNSAAESEDAAAGDADAGRFAIADGASESAYAGDWARLLVAHYVASPVQPGGWDAWLPAVQQRWLGTIDGRDLPWFLEDKFSQGAFATFLGLELAPRDGGWAWSAAAVGDCCLFQVRADALAKKFPILRAIDFDGSPDLLGSRQKAVTRDFWAAGELRSGDRLLAMSDALAHWFLTQADAGRAPWRAVAQVTDGPDPDAAFAAWVEQLRQWKVLKNDDVTLLVIDPA